MRLWVGAGKTTIARHYGTFLQQLGVLPKDSVFVETSGASLVHGGVAALKSELDRVKTAGGGVLFVDEAYQLKSEQRGEHVRLYTPGHHANSELLPRH